MPYEVFISHSSKDKKVADVICGFLEQRKIRCWIAPRDVQPGKKWASEIIGGLDQCAAMVLVFSQHSNESVQVARELERATSKGITIFPFRIDNSPLAPEMEYFISNTHWLDALTEPVELHLDTLYKSVRAQLELKDGKSQKVATEDIPDVPPQGSRIDILLWYFAKYQRDLLIPAWKFLKQLSPAYKLLLGGIVTIILLLIIISRSIGPPSPDMIKNQMQEAKKAAEEMQKDFAEIKRVNDSIRSISHWPYSNQDEVIESAWWKKESERFKKDIQSAYGLRGSAADKEVAHLKKKRTELDKWITDWQRLQPLLGSATRRIAIRNELAKQDSSYAKNLKEAAGHGVAAEKAMEAGDLNGVERAIGKIVQTLPPPNFPIETVVIHSVDKAATGYNPVILTTTDLAEYIETFLKAWGTGFRGIRLGMTAAELKSWASGMGASWVDSGNFAQPDRDQRDSTAVKMVFPVPKRPGSLDVETITVHLTQHFGPNLPSVVHSISVEGDAEKGKDNNGMSVIEEHFGKAVRMEGNSLFYMGSRLDKLKAWNRFIPDIQAYWRDTIYRVSIECPELREICREEWKAVVERSKTVADLPVNPLLSYRPKVDIKAFRLSEDPWTISAGMPRQELEAQAAAVGKKVSNNGNQAYVGLGTSAGIRALCKDRDKPDAITWVEYKAPASERIGALEVIQKYVERYGPPLEIQIEPSYARLNYSKDNDWDFLIILSFDNGMWRSVSINAGYDP